jgi:hypothetical protein
MPIARHWVVKTGGNEVTEEMTNAWKDNFLAFAMQNGCMRGALVADDERVIAGTIWPDLETLNSVIDSDAYRDIAIPIIASWGAGGISLPDDIELVCNGEILAMAVPEGL